MHLIEGITIAVTFIGIAWAVAWAVARLSDE